jgi:GNAT superfamily N-acetyltransferase
MHAVYRLMAYEYPRYRTHLLALDPESRYTRFGYPATDELINRLCDKIEANYQHHKIFAIEDEDLNIVAVGHIALEGGETELAFSVLKEHRQKGMGSALMARCIRWCQNRNIKGGSMVCLSTNTAIKQLAKKHGVIVNDGPESFANISIPEATPGSVVDEVVTSNLANFDHLGKLQRKYAKMITFPLQF